MAGGGIRQVDPAVAFAALAAVQVPARQGHLPLVPAVQADRKRALGGVEGGDGAATAIGDPELSDGVAAAHHPIPHRQRSVLDLEALGAEAAAGGQELLAGGVEPVDLAAPVGQQHHVLPGLCSACCQAAHQSCSSARVAAGLESAQTTRSWAR